MRILVIGSSGQVARCLSQRLPQAQYLSRADLDLTDIGRIEKVLADHAPEFLVNAAAYTAVDKAETEYEEALTVNGLAVERMARHCAQADVPLVHISTDYVFPGNGSRPYLESDPTDPINAYGRSKLAGELAIAAEQSLYAVTLRTSWVFSEFGNNFVRTMLRLAAERDSLNVVNDQLGRPTYAGDIADTIVRIVRRFEAREPIAGGLYHCASAGVASWFDLAAEVFRQAEQMTLIETSPDLGAISTSEFPTPAPRPAYSVLDTGKLDAALTWTAPEWSDGLYTVLQRL